VRTTIDIPDSTYRKLKSKAAADGRSVKEFMLEVVERELQGESQKKRNKLLPIVRSKKPGILDLTNEEIYGIIPFP
jgi:plasmid stability protein